MKKRVKADVQMVREYLNVIKLSLRIDHSRNTITRHNVLCLSPRNFA